jgi:hypothetical protein
MVNAFGLSFIYSPYRIMKKSVRFGMVNSKEFDMIITDSSLSVVSMNVSKLDKSRNS